MSDLPELRNEPTIESPRGDLAEFARGCRSAPERRDHRDDEPRKSRFKYLPTLLAILVALVGGWHWFAANHIEKQLTRNLGDKVREVFPGASVNVDVHPLTNLVAIEVTRPVRGEEGAFDILGDVIIEYFRREIEPSMERELDVVSRKDTDLYAMAVPYRVSISIDKVRAPAAPPPSRMVQEIQRQLGALGYDPGPADGRLGERTRNAILRFQRDHGLIEDGRASGELLGMLRDGGNAR